MKVFGYIKTKAVLLTVFALIFTSSAVAQTKPLVIPKTVRIDAVGLQKLLKPKGKPLLVNFWATWCDPCREEFPDLVLINREFRGKIDFITITLDDLAEIDRAVPKFLSEMKADMPNYLLSTPDESAAISAISPDYRGGLPFTILFDSTGKTAYLKQGKVKLPLLRTHLEQTLAK